MQQFMTIVTQRPSMASTSQTPPTQDRLGDGGQDGSGIGDGLGGATGS